MDFYIARYKTECYDTNRNEWYLANFGNSIMVIAEDLVEATAKASTCLSMMEKGYLRLILDGDPVQCPGLKLDTVSFGGDVLTPID